MEMISDFLSAYMLSPFNNVYRADPSPHNHVECNYAIYLPLCCELSLF